MKKILTLLLVLFSFFMISSVQSHALTEIEGPDIIHKEANQALTISNILQFYPLGVSVESDGFTGYGNVPGSYPIRLRQGDAVKDVEIVVIEQWGLDGHAPLSNSTDVLAVTDLSDIWVSSARKLTASEIVWNLLAVTGYFPNPGNAGFYYEGLTDEYTVLETEDDLLPEGEYTFSFRATFTTGFEGLYTSTIHVYEVPPMSGALIEPPANGIDKLVSWLPWLLIGGIVIYLISKKIKNHKKGWSY